MAGSQPRSVRLDRADLLPTIRPVDNTGSSAAGFDVQKELNRLGEDRHLNLFYCYGGHDEQGNPNEDNLTRAFICTIRMLTDNRRKQLLDSLFERAKHRMVSPDNPKPLSEDEKKRLRDIDFKQVEAALQGNVPEEVRTNAKEAQRLFMVTISSGDKPKDPSENDNGKGSCPDAWLFSRCGPHYCFMVECKCRDNPIDPNQMCRHWKTWIGNGSKSWNELAPTLLDLTWYDVLEVVDGMLPELSGRTGDEARADCMTLTHLGHFLSCYDYQLFKGFKLEQLRAAESLPPKCWRLFNTERGVARQ